MKGFSLWLVEKLGGRLTQAVVVALLLAVVTALAAAGLLSPELAAALRDVLSGS